MMTELEVSQLRFRVSEAMFTMVTTRLVDKLLPVIEEEVVKRIDYTRITRAVEDAFIAALSKKVPMSKKVPDATV